MVNGAEHATGSGGKLVGPTVPCLELTVVPKIDVNQLDPRLHFSATAVRSFLAAHREIHVRCGRADHPPGRATRLINVGTGLG
jgi:hypothetical protein